jgi:outer membrane protein assembly factor BamB
MSLHNNLKNADMKKILPAIVCFLFLQGGSLHAQTSSGFHVTQVYHIASSGGWDYLAVGPDNNRLYVSHGTQVNVLDETTGDSLGVIPNTIGVHGIAFVPALERGYTSNGRLNNITVFDLKTNQVLGLIVAGTNPDAIMYDDYSKLLITCNGRSQDLSLIDPVSEKLVATIAVGGKPETAVSDGKGKIYVNIEDLSLIAVVDIQTKKVIHQWPLKPAMGPSGLAIDLKNNLLFSGCDKTLAIMDIQTGKVAWTVPIADGCDGVAFDAGLGFVFASCGEGKLSIVHADANGYSLLENVPTKPSARTLALDDKTHTVFLSAGEFQKPTTPGVRPPLVPGTFQVLVVKR